MIFDFRDFRLMMDLDTKEYDLLNVTAADYAIEMDISKSQYEDFVTNH